MGWDPFVGLEAFRHAVGHVWRRIPGSSSFARKDRRKATDPIKGEVVREKLLMESLGKVVSADLSTFDGLKEGEALN